MKTKILLLTTVLFFAVQMQVLSQNIAKGYKFIEAEKFEKAVKIFSKSLNKRQNILEAKYGLSAIYSNENYRNYQPIRAYVYIKSVNLMFEKRSLDNKILLKKNYGITQKSIDEILNKVADAEKEKVLKINTEQGYNHYLDIFEGTKQADEIMHYRDSINYIEVKKANTFYAYHSFCKEYPESYFYPEAKQKYETIWKIMYNDVFNELELSYIKLFEKKYPDYPFYNDSTEIMRKFAERAQDLHFYLGYIANNVNFYPNFIRSVAPREMAFVCLQRHIEPDVYEKDWKTVIDTLNVYKEFFPNDARINGLISIFSAENKNISPKNLSKKINTNAYEYMPVISIDDKTLYFCAENRKGNIGGEDIFISKKVNGKWTEPRVLKDLNTSTGNEAALSISADGNVLLMFYNGDIYYSEKIIGGWSDKKIFPSINLEDDWEADASITADGNAVIFTSDRKGGVGLHHPFSTSFHGGYSGNTDIYISVKTETGWSKPFNIGTDINTPFAERTPFLHPDMKTLYFSSEGHNSIGKLDVYKSTRLNDSSWTEWSEPVNLGKEINSPNKEWGYKISTDGKIAYYTNFHDGESDINFIELPKELQPEIVITISGTVSDKNTKKPLKANIIWEDLQTNKKVGQLQSDPNTGKYIITLPMGKNYGFYIEKNDYYPLSGNIDLTKKDESENIIRHFQLITLESIINEQVAIPLKNVFFDYDKHTLKPESFPELNRFAGFLKNNPNLKIEISGHTDDRGGEDYNNNLSENRAKAVKKYLISQGCNENMLSAKGYGKFKPIADNSTEEGRAKNRRVEFKVLEK